VKVLEVDKARKRIALTMRLEDDAARAHQRDAGQRNESPRPQQGRQQQSSRPVNTGGGAKPAGNGGGMGALGGALAEALARAQSQKGR
jgi:uncharacterized protein